MLGEELAHALPEEGGRGEPHDAARREHERVIPSDDADVDVHLAPGVDGQRDGDAREHRVLDVGCE